MENRGLLSFAVAFVGLLCPCLTRLTPRVSFPTGSPGRHLTRFSSHDVSNTTTLLLSEGGDMLYVGARDAVLALDVSREDAIILRNKVSKRPLTTDRDSSCRAEVTLNISADGELYTGTVADYRGNRPVISRHLSEGRRVDLKLDDTLGWLEDPTFISSSFVPDEEKIYFFFSEVGREYDFIDKFVVSRVSQICMVRVKLFFCYFYTGTRGGTYTTRCTTSIRSALINISLNIHSLLLLIFQCGLHNASDNALRFVKENFLADDSVRPEGRSLTMVSAERYSHLTVQRVQAANNRDYTVLFLLTESGYLHKAVLLQTGAHIVEEVQVFEQPQPVKSLKLSVPKGVIYVGTSEGVVRVPIANCSFYWTCAQCVLARDPFCGWDAAGRACVKTPDTQSSLAQDVDRGNVEEACYSVTLTHRARFGPNSLPAGELVSVSLNEVVRLQCPAASRLSRQLWERPNSRLSSDLYLHLGDGSLSFVATPATLGHYLCLSTENGYQQPMAIYHVKQKSSPVAQTPTSNTRPQTRPVPTTQAEARPGPGPHTSEGPKRKDTRRGETEPTLSSRDPQVITRQLDRNFTLWTLESRPKDTAPRDGEPLQSAPGPSYLKELVVVSVLLVLCLSLLITILLYVVKQRCRRQTVPQAGTPTRDSDRRTPVEQEAPRGNQFLSKRNGQSPQGGQASGFGRNGALTGSNGHLPNTPI
ncbi:semaphorin-4A-like [Seriola lalandi dorsalis]|uniref:semaphorin-4A-like n=1 Tax=Seriola lalandi dorsalis TaxID=1841481 RepID=UPI000C6FBEE8|nr:semaphorin-4A-like [Seriola lalandi dorsalis]